MDNKIEEKFFSYNMITIAVIVLLPCSFRFLPKYYNSYFDMLDKVSIPIWAALYSFFWLKLNQSNLKIIRRIEILGKRIESYQRIIIKDAKYLEELKEDEYELNDKTIILQSNSRLFDFVNESLRVAVIIVAIIKVIQFFNNVYLSLK